MTDIELMIVAFRYRRKLKDISISKRQYELIEQLMSRKATSTDVSKKYEISVQNASQQLSNLFRKGYLTREEVSDKTGGYIYIYTTNPLLLTTGLAC